MSQPLHCKVAILGAGPGGAVASLTLSQLEIPHVVLDKANFPRDKICGDAFSGKVVDILNKLHIDIEEKTTQLPSWGVTFVAPNGKALRIPFQPSSIAADVAPGFISTRLDFDHLLVQRMVESKYVDFQPGVEVRQFKREQNLWHLYDKEEQYLTSAEHLIVADGAHSAFARNIGGIHVEPKHYAAGIRAYYEGVSGMDHENFIELHFLKEFIPGYLWIFPLPEGRANVGIGLRSDMIKKRGMDLKKMLPELIERHPALKERFKNAKPIDKIRGYGLPLGSKRRCISGDGYYLVGDAGSLIDPFTGEGIGNAMISGKVAAEVVAEIINDPSLSPSIYDERVYSKLGKELKLSYQLQQLATKRWLFNLLINKATTNEALSQMISNMFLDLDIRDQLKQPSFYFKLMFK